MTSTQIRFGTIDDLTSREVEVMHMLTHGHQYKQIARMLHISVKTVETHASAILRKLHVANRTELTRWAALEGVLR